MTVSSITRFTHSLLTHSLPQTHTQTHTQTPPPQTHSTPKVLAGPDDDSHLQHLELNEQHTHGLIDESIADLYAPRTKAITQPRRPVCIRCYDLRHHGKVHPTTLAEVDFLQRVRSLQDKKCALVCVTDILNFPGKGDVYVYLICCVCACVRV